MAFEDQCPYVYPLTQEDIQKDGVPQWPADLARRFHVDLSRLLEINQGPQSDHREWKAGVHWLIPFETPPGRGLGAYHYPFKDKPRVKLDDFTSPVGPLRDGTRFTVPDEDGNEVPCPLWNNLNLDAQSLWLHWGNRYFRAWQIEHGGKIDDLATGDDCHDLILPFIDPVEAGPYDVRPSDPASPDGRNTVVAPLTSLLDLRALAVKLDYLRGLLVLCRRGQEVAFREATSVLGQARALSGLADLLMYFYDPATRNENYADAYQTGIFNTHVVPLRAAANALYKKLADRIPSFDPLLNIAPRLRDDINNYATQLSNLLSDTKTVDTIEAVYNERRLTDDQKLAALRAFGFYLEAAMGEAVLAPNARLLFVEMLKKARLELVNHGSNPRDSAISSLISVFTATTGNVPGAWGPDSFSIGMLKLLGIQTVEATCEDTAAASSLMDDLTEALIKALRLSGEDADTFRTKLNRLRIESVAMKDTLAAEGDKASPARAEVDAFLKEKINAEEHIAGGIGIILNVFQLALAFHTFKQDSATIGDYASTGLLATQTVQSGVAWIGGWKVNGAELSTRFQLLFKVSESLARPITCVIAVASIVSGAAEAIEALERWRYGDGMKLLIGGLQVLSGVAIIGGITCEFLTTVGLEVLGASAAGALGPVGVAVGIVAGALTAAEAIHEMTRPPPSRYFRALLETMRNAKSSWNSAGIVAAVGAMPELEAVCAVVDRIDRAAHGSGIAAAPIEDVVFAPITSGCTFMPGGASVSTFVDQVAALGFERSQASEMVRVSGPNPYATE